MWIKILSSFSLLVVLTQAHISVVGPLVSKNAAYETFITASEITKNQDLAVYLDCDGKLIRQKFNLKIGKTFSQQVKLEFDKPVTEECEFGTVMRQKQGNTNFCYEDRLKVMKKTATIVMIQTDKPVYKPNDLLRYQIVALDATTKPIVLNQVHVDILDAKQNLILSKTFTDITKPNFGFHQSELLIAEEPNMGTWTIKVKINDEKMVTPKSFGVDFYNLPSFKVNIEAPSTISFMKKVLKFKVSSTYGFDKPAKGTAKVKATVYSDIDSTDETSSFELEPESVGTDGTNFKVHFRDDLELNFLAMQFYIVLDVEFEEEGTGVKTKGSKQILLLPDTKYAINLNNPSSFKPGFNYTFKTTVTTRDGQLEKSTTLPLTIHYEYGYLKKPRVPVKSSISTYLQNGVGKLVLNPPLDAIKVDFKITYDDTKAQGVINAHESSNNDEFIQITMLNDIITLNENVMVQVETNSFFQELAVVVMTGRGIVHSRHLSDLEPTKVMKIPIKITAEMAPQADVIVYYLRDQDGGPVYDHLKINLEMKGDNFLTITTEPQDQLNTGSKITINAQTKQNSLVALLGVDQGVSFMGIKNLISQSAFEKKFMFSNEEYKTLRDINSQDRIFSKTNAFNLIPSKSMKQKCTPVQESLFNNSTVGRIISGRTRNVTPFASSSAKDTIVRSNFPDIWIYDVQETSTGQISLQNVTPDSITTWMLNGFSINPEYGFAVAETKKISVFKDFFIKVEKPVSSKPNEIITIKVIAYNYMANSVTAMVKMTKINDEFDFVSGTRESQSIRVEKDGLALVSFKIKPKKANVHLNIEAKAGSVTDSVQDSFFVKAPGIDKFVSKSSIVDLRKSELESLEFNLEIPDTIVADSVKCEANAATNLIGSALSNVDQLIKSEDKNGKKRIESFAIALMAKNYLASIGKPTERIDSIIRQNYQNIIALQKTDGSSIDGGFSKYSESSKISFDYLWSIYHDTFEKKDLLDLSIYIARLLGQLNDTQFSMEPLNKAINYIQRRQKYDGRLQNNGKPQFEDLSKFEGIPGVSLTALTLIGIHESDYLRKNYQNIMENGLGFIDSNLNDILDSGNNYERALTLYLYVLLDKPHDDLLAKLKSQAIESVDQIYWEFEDKTPSSLRFNIEISSYVALALTKLGKSEDFIKIAKFLVSNRTPDGGFGSTLSTVVGLQALAEISKALYSPTTKLTLDVKNQDNEEILMALEPGKTSTQEELPSNTRKVSITASGGGVASVQASCFYKQKMTNLLQHFEMTVNARKYGRDNLKVEICVKTKDGRKSNTAQMIVNLPTGFEYRSGPTEKIESLRRLEKKDGNTKIVMAFESFDANRACFTIEGIKKYDASSLEKSEISLYDSVDPEKYGIFFYDVK